ncbi:copper resistance D family protein [Paenibacillus paeoniae]|uniref:Copper resistance protein D domain-containing protein n=1 Tax=Paenibacillus paeoniae TaxID=2292705 RepID=A0A371PM49_9BACL|nr:CopD family protein [Paenibacillus paeoniae]REK76719.1 hypothetical protein DX130_06685 [Paenibacillus paeoniae]
MYIYLFETLLYLSFAFTGGFILLLFVPEGSKPQMKIPFDLFQYGLLAIPVFSFMSILRTSFILRAFAENMPYYELLLIVLKDYKFGNAWIWMLIGGAAMYAIAQLFRPKIHRFKWLLAGIWCLTVLAHGWASHPAGFSSLGFVYQSVHVAAVSLWLGVLILVAWFTSGSLNWKPFVRWYTPMAVSSMLLIVFAGFAMMYILVDGYFRSWGINYGEALLLKHLVFLPLLLLAFMNGFLTKISKQGKDERKLIRWLRIETVIALAILAITAYMGMQEPPHEGEFEDPVPSGLFTLLHGDVSLLNMRWHWNLPSVVLILVGGAALSMLFSSYKRNKHSHFSLLAALAVICLFLGLLLAVH